MYLVMELCEGGELADMLKENKTFSEQDTKKMMQRLTSAVSYLHKNGKSAKIWSLKKKKLECRIIQVKKW